MVLGHLLTRFGLAYREVSSHVNDSFCQLGSSISLPWVIYFETFYLRVVSSFSCIPVICIKLVLFLTPLQFVHLFCNFFKSVCPKLKYKRRQHFAVNLVNLLGLQKKWNIVWNMWDFVSKTCNLKGIFGMTWRANSCTYGVNFVSAENLVKCSNTRKTPLGVVKLGRGDTMRSSRLVPIQVFNACRKEQICRER